MSAFAWIVIVVFVAGVTALSRFLRRFDADGSFDVPPSSASRPGVRRLFDFGDGGWGEDGINQRPMPR
ncbi:MAG: hypothetical protein JXA83_04875 [Acidimicrobiales bacterium]|nr:hypothetical protein [Acidimicrobiales bacterium]